MGDEYAGGRALGEQVFQQLDAVDVEVVGRFVEQQQLRLEGEGEGQCRPLAFTPRGHGRAQVFVDPEPVQVLDQPRLGTPARALVVDLLEMTACDQALAQRAGIGERGLLLDERGAQPVAAADLTGVQCQLARDHAQQRRLAGAVAADQADALAAAHRQRCAVEQRVQAISEFGVGEGEQGHEAREHRTREPGPTGPVRRHGSGKPAIDSW